MNKWNDRLSVWAIPSLLGLALALILVFAAGNLSVLASIVRFEDPGLEAAVREALGIPTAAIDDQDVLRITTLDARHRNISTLEGIEQLVNLTELDLYGNRIVDISPLSELINLTTLILSRNEIVDVSPLSPLDKLKRLELCNNQICDIQPLVGNPDFAGAITLSFNPLPLQAGSPAVGQIEALQGRGASIVFGAIIVFSDAGIEAAVREAIGKPTGDIQEADVLTLTTLDARYRNITHLEGLEHCVNLTELDLYGNSIVHLSELAGLTKLTRLVLEDNEIVDLSPLSGLSRLTHLYLDNNHIVDLSPLAGLTQLEMLYLWDNEISDLQPLSGLNHLAGLYLYFNSISEISPLSGLTQLTALGLSGNQIVDIHALSGLVNLRRLYVDHNLIADISPLVGNEGLNQGDIVRLQGNPLPLEPGSPARRDIDVLLDRGVLISPMLKDEGVL